MTTVKKSLGDIKVSKKRLDKIASINDEDIDYSDIPELDEDFFKNATVCMPEQKKGVYVRLDGDVLEWFKSQGKGYQTRMNKVLRSYYEAHQK